MELVAWVISYAKPVRRQDLATASCIHWSCAKMHRIVNINITHQHMVKHSAHTSVTWVHNNSNMCVFVCLFHDYSNMMNVIQQLQLLHNQQLNELSQSVSCQSADTRQMLHSIQQRVNQIEYTANTSVCEDSQRFMAAVNHLMSQQIQTSQLPSLSHTTWQQLQPIHMTTACAICCPYSSTYGSLLGMPA